MFSEAEYQVIWSLYSVAVIGLSLSLGWFLAWFPFKPVITFLRVFVLVALLIPGVVVDGDARLAPQLLALGFDAWLVGGISPDKLIPVIAMAACVALVASLLHYGWTYWRGTRLADQSRAASPPDA